MQKSFSNIILYWPKDKKLTARNINSQKSVVKQSVVHPSTPTLGAIPNFATEKEQKRNFLDFNDVTLVVVDIKSERFIKKTCF